MGQYYKAVIMPPIAASKSEILVAYDPCSHGEFCKMMEHAYMPNDFVCTIESFFRPGEKFYKHRLVWAGDYADPEEGIEDNLYSLAEAKEEKTKFRKSGKSFRYLVNHTQKVYLDKRTAKPDAEGWTIHPLPILTADVGSGGGGDYHPQNETQEKYVGAWARDIISVEEGVPAGFSAINVSF